MTDKWDLRFLELAELVSMWSKDPSTCCGAAIVRSDKTIASTGFNGCGRTMEDRPEWYNDREEKYARIIHAEVNCLIHARESVIGCTLYTYPFICCDRCCVQMLQAGIIRFVSLEPTEDVLVRWGNAFEHTRKYIKECGATLLEVPLDDFMELGDAH
jgi:dCMP deaminase